MTTPIRKTINTIEDLISEALKVIEETPNETYEDRGEKLDSVGMILKKVLSHI